MGGVPEATLDFLHYCFETTRKKRWRQERPTSPQVEKFSFCSRYFIITPKIKTPQRAVFILYHIFARSSSENEVSHRINGSRSLSMLQSASLNSDALSIRKRESIDLVTCNFADASLLCSITNCCFLLTRYPRILM